MADTPGAGADTSSTLTPISSAAPSSPAPPHHLGAALPAPGSSAIASPYTAFRDNVRRELRALAHSLRQRRAAGEPATPDQFRDAVENALKLAGASKRTEKEGKAQWELDARQATLDRAWEELANEAAVYPAGEAAFAHLQDVLDAVLCAFETGFVDETFPLSLLSGLMELRPITACEPLLGYIETRAERLTKGMEYVRGRGPILLRLLNDLLRRLPRSQSEPVILSGRILLLLSSVYPLGEKSGVNLRGNFNTGKGTVWEQEAAAKEMDGAKEDAMKELQDEEDAKMTEVEEGEEAEPGQGGDATSSSGFYATFWSLQRYFNNPHLLFAPPAASSPHPAPFAELQSGVRTTLAAFAAATKKEKELAGTARDDAKGSARDQEGQGEDGLEEFFFPKFLTSRNLLDLELADPSFRRQILVQLLILFQYFLALTPSARERLAKLPVTNQPALTAHVVPSDVEAWVRELRSRTLDEMDGMEGGRRFRKAVMVVLTREQNWTDWKLRSCFPFTKPSLPPAESSATARARQQALARRPKRYPYALGNPRLDRLWRKNTTSLEGFEPSVGADDLDSLLAPTGAYTQSHLSLSRARTALFSSTPGSAARAAAENGLAAAEAAHQAATWRAVRAAAGSELRFFAGIGSGDVERLRGFVDAERRERDGQVEGEREGGQEKSGEGGDEKSGEGGDEKSGEGGEGYESDESVLGLRPPKVKVKEAGTPEPPETVVKGAEGDAADTGDFKMDADDAAGTPPPPDTDAAPKPATDEPGTPPPKEARLPPSPGTPGTPKRPREEDVDVQMGEGETEAKRARIE